MSVTAHQLAQLLKRIAPADSSNVRLARSLSLVHTFAMSIPLQQFANAEQAAEAQAPVLKKIINDVNEFVAIDSRLTQGLLLPTLRLRFELLNGTSDPAIISMVLRSETAAELKGPDDLAMSQYLTTRPEFIKEQAALGEQLRELLAESAR